jgi:ABC-type amino acid transport substrate-binding protein
MLIGLAALSLAGCAGRPQPAERDVRPPPEPPLVVGVAAESPPMAFMRNDRLVGLEVDFARALAAELGRPVRFIDFDWDDLFKGLLRKQVDIVMSGMTVTKARELRVAFTDPYLESGLVALVRRPEVEKYSPKEKLFQTNDRVGFRIATTGEKFVAEHMRFATRSGYRNVTDAALELRQQRIDIFVSDAPIVAWLVSANEADLAGLWTPLTKDQLAWAVRPDDVELRSSVNEILAHWKRDGTARAILRRWLRGLPGL